MWQLVGQGIHELEKCPAKMLISLWVFLCSKPNRDPFMHSYYGGLRNGICAFSVLQKGKLLIYFALFLAIRICAFCRYAWPWAFVVKREVGEFATAQRWHARGVLPSKIV